MAIGSNEPGNVATAGERIWIQLKNAKEIFLDILMMNVLNNLLPTMLAYPVGGSTDTICCSISLKTSSSKTASWFQLNSTKVFVKFPI